MALYCIIVYCKSASTVAFKVLYVNNFIHLKKNVTENTVARIERAEKPSLAVFGKMDKSLQRSVPLGKHVAQFPVKDLDELVKK